MLQTLHGFWGYKSLVPHKGAMVSDELLEVMSSRTYTDVPEVAVKDYPEYTEHIEALVNVLHHSFRLRRKHARSLVWAVVGDGSYTYHKGTHLDRKYTKVSTTAMKAMGYHGVGYKFYDTPPHLLWVLLYRALGPGAFILRASKTQTLLAVKDESVFHQALSWSKATYGCDPFFWAREFVDAKTPHVFTRMLAVFDNPPPLWMECPDYYRNMVCLAEVLYDEPPPVVLGALCPQISRAIGRLPQGTPKPIYQWYLDAGDSRRPMEWRKQVVRALALTCTYTLPNKTPEVSMEALKEALPGITVAVPILKLVKSFCVAKLDYFPVLVPDSYQLKGDTRALDRAVCVGSPTRAKRRLPSIHVSDKVRGLLQAMGK